MVTHCVVHAKWVSFAGFDLAQFSIHTFLHPNLQLFLLAIVVRGSTQINDSQQHAGCTHPTGHLHDDLEKYKIINIWVLYKKCKYIQLDLLTLNNKWHGERRTYRSRECDMSMRFLERRGPTDCNLHIYLEYIGLTVVSQWEHATTQKWQRQKVFNYRSLQV